VRSPIKGSGKVLLKSCQCSGTTFPSPSSAMNEHEEGPFAVLVCTFCRLLMRNAFPSSCRGGDRIFLWSVRTQLYNLRLDPLHFPSSLLNLQRRNFRCGPSPSRRLRRLSPDRPPSWVFTRSHKWGFQPFPLNVWQWPPPPRVFSSPRFPREELGATICFLWRRPRRGPAGRDLGPPSSFRGDRVSVRPQLSLSSLAVF